MKTAEKIALCRKRRGMSQEQLAAALGISRQAVSRWETGESLPDTERVVGLSRLLGVTTDYLLLDEVSDEAPPAAQQKAPPDIPGHAALTRSVFRVRLAVCLAAAGLVAALACLAAAYIVSCGLSEWYTELGRFGTALFCTPALWISLSLGAVCALCGAAMLAREYRHLGE